MRRISIVVSKDQIPNLLSYAGSRRLLHLTEIDDEEITEGSERYQAVELLARASTIKSRITSLTTTLSIEESSPEAIKAPVGDIEELSNFLDAETLKLEQSVRQIEDEQGKLQAEKEQDSELSRFLAGLEKFGVSLDEISGSGFLASLVGEAATENIPSIKKELDQITSGNIVFAITNINEQTQTFLAIFQNSFAEDAKKAITALGAKPSPAWTNLPNDPKQAKETIDAKLSDIEGRLKSAEERGITLAKEQGPTIKSLALLSETLDARAKALAGSSSTESTALLQAWVPEKQVREISEGVSNACNGLATVYIEEEEALMHNQHDEGPELPAKENPPTLVISPGWTKPLQGIIDNFGIPSYGETNPLPFMILTFPLIYGLMFGDIGEGLLFVVFGLFLLYLKRKKTKVFEIGQIFVNGAELILMLGIGVTIFGFVFGDIFGFESEKVLGIKPIFAPTAGAFPTSPSIAPSTANLIIYMIFILFFGVAHYLSGLAINAYNKIRNHEYRHALLGPISWAWFYTTFIYAAVLVVNSGFKFSTLIHNPIVLVSLFVPFGLLGYGEGGLHLMEVFIGAGSNTLSYLRIWALNLADFAVKFAFFTSFGIGGAIFGNILVMILEGLIVFVQTLRLHWVEWFGKFYEGTGHAFAPYQEPMNWIVSQ